MLTGGFREKFFFLVCEEALLSVRHSSAEQCGGAFQSLLSLIILDDLRRQTAKRFESYSSSNLCKLVIVRYISTKVGDKVNSLLFGSNFIQKFAFSAEMSTKIEGMFLTRPVQKPLITFD